MLMGASLALAGLSGCGPSAAPAPRERIVPYVRLPEGIVPGRPLFFATAMALAGDVQGLLVESHEGRPTKVEGNPDHPANRPPSDVPGPHTRFGPTDAFAQASVLTLYDPDRSQAVTNRGAISTWDDCVLALRAALQNRESGRRVRILTETVSSPTLARQLRTVVQRYPNAKWHRYEPVGTENAIAGARLAFGEDVQIRYRIDQADVILALDADLLTCGPEHVRHLREFSDRRRVRHGQAEPRMNRLYVIESTPSSSGAIADHRLPLRSVDIEAFARALAGLMDARFRPIACPAPPQVPTGWLDALARDLNRHRGTSLIVAGESQPPFVHALVHALNDFLGNIGTTVVSWAREFRRTRRRLAARIGGRHGSRPGRGDVLLILGGNPVYTAPADLRLAERMDRVPLRIHLGLYQDETSALCHWHIPEAHFLESWGDVRSPDGTVSIVQPLIAPLHDGKSALEVLAPLTDPPEQSSYDLRSSYGIVRAFWHSSISGDFEACGEKTLYRRPRRQIAIRN